MAYIVQYGPFVRRTRGPNFDINCEQLTPDGWECFRVFNEMSNDYAYTEADAACRAKQAELTAPTPRV